MTQDQPSTAASPPSPVALILSDDMLFTSRIVATARNAGLPVITVRSPRDAEVRSKEGNLKCIFIDLTLAGIDISNLVPSIRDQNQRPPLIVAYGPHVDTAALQAARAAGCDLVLTRGKFVEELQTSLPKWLGS